MAISKVRSVTVLHLLIYSSVCWLSAAVGEVHLVQQSPLGLTCPGDQVVYQCTLPGMTVFWRFPGGEITLIRTSNEVVSGNFRAQPVGVVGENFTSTLTFTAESGTVITCINGDRSMNDSQTVIVQERSGAPSIPSLSCVDLSEDVSGAVSVGVSWTLSDGDSAYSYQISIVTNDPQPPYGGHLNSTTSSVTLTGFQAGYEYTITVRGVNCGSQEGNESEPLTITPQVPDTPASCNSTAIYNQSSGMLLAINSVWDALPDHNLGATCPGSSGNVEQYQIKFQTRYFVDTESVNASRCENGRCRNAFELAKNGSAPSSYDNVSVAAENVVGVGDARTCTTQPISTTNNLLNGQFVDVRSPVNATFNCTFLSGFTGSARCRVQYGTDPTYMNLPYSADSDESGTAGDSVSVILREQLNSTTVYYFTVSAVGGDVIVNVLAESFTTPEYNCSIMELWNLPAPGAEYLDDVEFLDYASCDGVQCVGLNNTTLMTVTVVAYNNTSPGSTVHFFTDESAGYVPNITTSPERQCKSDLTWSGDPVVSVCILPSLSGWLHIALIVIGASALVVAITITVCIFIIIYKKEKRGCFISVSLIEISGLFLLVGTPLWIVMAFNTQNYSCVLLEVKGWLMFQFLFGIITLVTVVPFTLVELVRLLHELTRNGIDGVYEKCLRRAYRVYTFIACVVCMIGAALWIAVGATVAIPPSDISATSPLETWQAILLVVGGILLGIVFLFTIFAYCGHQWYNKLNVSACFPPIVDNRSKVKYDNSVLYLSLRTIAVIFCAIGVALWITVGVVMSNPPNDNVCDVCWRESRDGLVIAGLLFSILALVYAIAMIIWVYSVECKAQPPLKCTIVMMVMIVLLCLSVIGIPLVIIVWCQTRKGGTGDKDGSHEQKAVGRKKESIEMSENVAYITLQPGKPTSTVPPHQTDAQSGDGGGGGGGGGQEYSHIQHGKPPNPSDPKYSHLNQGTQGASRPPAEDLQYDEVATAPRYTQGPIQKKEEGKGKRKRQK